MEKSILTFNDLPEVVAQLRDEVMSLKSLLAEQRSVNNAKTVDTHVPMSVDEAAEYLGIPKGRDRHRRVSQRREKPDRNDENREKTFSSGMSCCSFLMSAK